MPVSLENFKHHLKIDYADEAEDASISLYLNTAKGFVLRYTGLAEDNDQPEYEICVYLLAAHLYETRQSAGEANIKTYPHGFEMLLIALRQGYF